ncbi:MAG: hypothetical protein KAV87_67835 [Desulfobacteraceae bacterium]|nr:hypothetical protein [Desulfobacteraceae bacterium]
MKKGVLLGAVILLAALSVVQAQESELHGVIDATYTSKYIWRGFDIYDDHSAIHPLVDLDLFGTGFGVSVLGHRANAGSYELSERWDYTLYYQNQMFAGECYATNYRLGYVYYNYPDRSSHDLTDSIDLQELHGIFSFPELLPIKGLVPTYVLVKLWPSNSGSIVGTHSPGGGTASGFVHIFMLDYGVGINCPFTGEPRTLNLHAEAIYNDGVSPNGATDVDHDWSNAFFGVSTVFDLSDTLTLTPAVYYQSSWDDSVNTEDEVWAGLSMTYKF